MFSKIKLSRHEMFNIDHIEFKHNQFNNTKPFFFDKFNYIHDEKNSKTNHVT